MKKLIFALFTAVLLAAPVMGAVDDSSEIIFPLLHIGVGAKALSMAEAYVSVCDNSTAVFWNAAGLAQVKDREISLSFDKWFLDTYYQHITAAVPMGKGTAGADMFYMNYGSFVRSDENGAYLPGKISSYNIGGSIAYGYPVTDKLSMGGALKFIHQTIGELSYNGAAIDIGALYKYDKYSFGLNFQNMGFGEGYFMPFNIRAGVSAKVAKQNEHELLVAVGGDYLFKDTGGINFGMEYSYSDMLYVRLGYKYRFEENTLGRLAGLSAGAGFMVDTVKIDYAAVFYGDLGLTHRVSATYLFGSNIEAIKKKEDEKIQKEADASFEKAARFEKEGKFKKALVTLRELLKLNNRDAPAWKKMGDIYHKLEEKEYAIECYENYLILTPDEELYEWLEEYRLIP